LLCFGLGNGAVESGDLSWTSDRTRVHDPGAEFIRKTVLYSSCWSSIGGSFSSVASHSHTRHVNVPSLLHAAFTCQPLSYTHDIDQPHFESPTGRHRLSFRNSSKKRSLIMHLHTEFRRPVRQSVQALSFPHLLGAHYFARNIRRPAVQTLTTYSSNGIDRAALHKGRLATCKAADRAAQPHLRRGFLHSIQFICSLQKTGTES